MRKIRIETDSILCEGELYDTSCARAIWDALPLGSQVDTWGEELYFYIPVHHELEQDAQEIVDEGDLGYWPQGSAFCIFFGPTPLSQSEEIRPAGAVNIIGKIYQDPKQLRAVKSGEFILVEKVSDGH